MKFLILGAAVSGALAAPGLTAIPTPSHTPSVSAPISLPSISAPSVSVPEHEAPSCVQDDIPSISIISTTTSWASLPTASNPSISVPLSGLPSASAPISALPSASSTPNSHDELPEHEQPTPEVGKVCEKVILVVAEVKELVEDDLESIKAILGAVEDKLDVEKLLLVLKALKVHLGMILTKVVPALLGLVFKVGKVAEGDVKAVLDVLKEIKLIIAAVEVSLEELVGAVGGDVLKLVMAEIIGLLKLITLIVGPILKFVIGLLAVVKGLIGDLLGGLVEILSELENVDHGAAALMQKVAVPV